jgi:hypothetical protein
VKRDEKSIQAIAGDDAGRRRFAVAVPSAYFGDKPQGAKKVAILLDRSGSMEGSPIQQAKKAVEACLAGLAPEDQFGIVAFDNTNELFADGLKPGDRGNRAAAAKFLAGIEARGGTELASGVEAATAMLGGPGGSILILTDGQVFGTDVIVRKAKQTGTRLFCLGIGSASQDRFLSLLASQTGGVSRFVSPRERVDITAVDLFASMDQPVAKDVRVNGMLQAGAIFAGAPLIAFGTAEASAEELSLAIEWDSGVVPAQLIPFVPADAEVVRCFEGARRIAAGENVGAQYGLADETMSLVAVIRRNGDKPGELAKTVVVPVGMPQDVEMARYHLGGSAPRGQFQVACCMSAAPPPSQAPAPFLKSLLPRFSSLRAKKRETPSEPANLPIELVSRIEPDGGMPGKSIDQRIERSIAAILFFQREGSTEKAGPFRAHVRRLYAFLRSNGWDGKLEIGRDVDKVIQAML